MKLNEKKIRGRSLVLPLLLLGVGGDGSSALAQSAGTFTATGSMTAVGRLPGTFESTGRMGVPRVGHTATLLLTGKVLICGGANSNTSLGTVWASAELYDPASGAFTSTGNMATARKFHTATLLPDGTVLLAGGTASANSSFSTRSAELYDPATGTFTPVPDMVQPRMSHTATLLKNGNVLFAGGLFDSSAEIYDPVTRIFSATGPMRTARHNSTTSLLPDGSVLIAGGYGHDDGPIPGVERYHPDTGVFRPAGATGSIDSVGPEIASLLTNGQVLMPLHQFGAPTSLAQVYDPATETFTDMENMHAARISTATLLPDGKVLMAGQIWRYAPGYLNGVPSTDLYDPMALRFVATGEMLTPRYYHTATLLNDGSVLIVGGLTSVGGISGVGDHPAATLSTAELYTPDVLVSAPALLSVEVAAKEHAAILHADTHVLVSATDPAIGGEALEIYCAGLDKHSMIPPQVAIGGRTSEILFFGEAPGYPGLNQVNIRVPGRVTPGTAIPLRLVYLGRASNQVTLSVQ